MYCTVKCRLEHILEAYDAAHADKKGCKRRGVKLVNVRRTYCTAYCLFMADIDRKKKCMAERAEAARKAKADPNYLENYVKKIQREAEERRRALRGLS